jgi:hypothetical protein
VLLRSEQLSESGQGRLKSVERTVDRLTRFSQDILTLSAGQLEIAKGPVNVSDLFQQSAARLWPDQTEVALTCEIDEDLEVAGDATKLEQVVDNLLLNAFEAGASRVWVSATVGPASVLIKVEDDGPGCPPAELEDLFRAFYTTKSRATGAGLGLSLVKAIIESHGGRVSAYSKTLTGQTDHGLIVLLTLPLPDAKGPVGGITLVKAGMPEVGRVIRVLQNVSVAPRIAETPAEIDPDSGAVLVSDDTASRCWPDLTQSGRLHLLSLEEDALLVTAGGRKPQLFSEEYVLRELLPEPQGA